MLEEKDPTPLVKDWYSQEQWFLPPNKEGLVDREMLTKELVLNKVVLNLGPLYPDDELYYGSMAKEWIAVDFSPEVIARCRSFPGISKNVHFFTHDVRDLLFNEDTFDIVCDFSTGDHLNKIGFMRMLSRIYYVLKPNGLFVISYANTLAFTSMFPDGETEHWGGDFGYWRTISPMEAEKYVTDAGFVKIKHFNRHGDRSGITCRKPR